MKGERLKPCPFCGGRASFVKAQDLHWQEGGYGHHVICSVGRSGGCGSASGWSKTERGAMRKWNKRPTDRRRA